MSIKDTIALIHQFGGKAFLAHPNVLKLEDSKMDLLIQNMKKSSLDGIEIYNSSIKDYSYSCFLKKLSQKHQLLFSPKIISSIGLDSSKRSSIT